MVPLIVLLLVLVLVVFPLWAIVKILSLGKENETLARRQTDLERELREVRDKVHSPIAPVVPSTTPATPLAETLGRNVSPPLEHPAHFESGPQPHPALTPPSLDVQPASAQTAFQPPPLPEPKSAPVPMFPAPPKPVRVQINWEQFMGVKLFAWLGGLAAFLGAVFFVKYSFEHDLIPPEVRVAIGYLFAIGLVIGGLKVNRGRYAVTSQTLVATGVVCLYGVTFACNSIYHFAFFETVATFLLMTLITAAAFFLAVRLEGQVIAVLGILGGFLTPWLLSTGRDNPLGLFGYITLLDLGLIAVALHRQWHFLFPLGAAGTVAMQVGWASKYLSAARAPVAMTVCLVFCALFLAAYFVTRWSARRWAAPAGRRDETSDDPDAPGFSGDVSTEAERRVPLLITACAVAFPFVAFAFAAVFLGFGTVAARPGLLFSFVLAADLGLLTLAWFDERSAKLHLVTGAVVFILLAAWTGSRLTNDLLPWALVFYLLHAILHTAFPLVLERHRPDAAPGWWSQLFPPLALLLMLGPLFKLDVVSLAFWPCVLLIDLLAIALALITASLTGVVVVLLLTLGVTGLWVFRVPATIDATPSMLLVVGGFAVLFFAAGIFLARRLGDRLGAGTGGGAAIFGDVRGQIPAFSALLPFMLLVMMSQRLPLANPSPVFGLALLLIVLTLGLTFVLTIEWLPACGLAGIAALEYAWRARHFHVENASVALGWFLFFHAVFAVYPFVFRRRFAPLTGPWAVAAIAGLLQFPLVYQLVQRAWPNDIMGVLPALFALPPLASLFAILRLPVTNERARLNQLAWFGGVALFFITLIFPIQFERQWITLGWALEGTALLWLFHRVPHPALRATGVVLLIAAFVRLALNPAVLEYQARSTTPIFNWYLYSYGIVIVSLFVGGRLLAPPRERVLGSNAPALLATLGTVLAFLLLNIEIADFFSVSGARVLVFEFSGNFARDMTYTIAWALFALGLLLISFWKHQPAGRYAAQALLGVALLKLFLHDLARLEALYRIGAFFAVAIIASVASFAYQRFLPGNEKSASEKS